jgi:2-dehydropantoate 2-reductase
MSGNPASPKIAVVGCGALGSYYGAMLARAGHDVHFLLRSDYGAVRREGVHVQSTGGNFVAFPKAARLPSEIGEADLVLIGLKTTANGEFGRLLPPLVGPGTVVLTLQNGLGNEEQLARLFPGAQILGGLCFVCLNRVAPGHVRHLGHGQIVLGEFAGQPQPRTHQLVRLFQDAGVPCLATDHLARARWEKLVWNVPFNGLGVAGIAGYPAVESGQLPQLANLLRSCLATDELLADERWFTLVLELMNEVVRGAAALGYVLPERIQEKLIDLTRSMGPYKASTLLDFERGSPLELESLFLEPWRRARAAGLDLPRLGGLCHLLQHLDRHRLQGRGNKE